MDFAVVILVFRRLLNSQICLLWHLVVVCFCFQFISPWMETSILWFFRAAVTARADSFCSQFSLFFFSLRMSWWAMESKLFFFHSKSNKLQESCWIPMHSYLHFLFIRCLNITPCDQKRMQRQEANCKTVPWGGNVWIPWLLYVCIKCVVLYCSRLVWSSYIC